MLIVGWALAVLSLVEGVVSNLLVLEESVNECRDVSEITLVGK
jgi:hypothetical protein